MKEISVSLIDKSFAMRKLIANVLKKIPSVTVVSSSESFSEGLNKAQDLKAEMIFVEYDFPDIKGSELIRSLKEKCSSAKIVLVTKISREEILLKDPMVLLDIYAYIKKPEASLKPTQDFDKYLNNFDKFLSEFQKLFFKFLVGQVKKKHSVSLDGIIAIGASTGGPEATIEFLENLSKNIETPIVIAIHMPENFTKPYADRLTKILGRPVNEAVDGVEIKPREIWLAPGNHHLFLEKRGAGIYLRTNQMPLVNSCRPSVDSLFASLPECFGSKVTAVVLTGMGSDGLEGAKLIHQYGGVVFAQDSQSSKIWGMPQVVILAGITTQVGTPAELAKSLLPISKVVQVGA